MLFIKEKEIENLVNMKSALDVFRQAYKDNAAGKIYTGGRVVEPIRGEENCGQWLTAISEAEPYFGSKFASVFPANLKKNLPSVISSISIYSAITGELVALLEANYLTAIKTGGSAGVATDLMANKNASKLGIIGSGLQAYTQVLPIQEVRELTELHVYDINPEYIDAFIEKIKKVQNRPYKIFASKTADECVSNSDIVSTCTTSLKPVFSASALKDGTHVNAVGSFTPFMQEIEDEVVTRSSRIITEHVDGLWAAAGDIIIPFEKGLITKDDVHGSVGDVITGKVSGREKESDITLYESVGSCVLDMGIAIAVYKEVLENTKA